MLCGKQISDEVDRNESFTEIVDITSEFCTKENDRYTDCRYSRILDFPVKEKVATKQVTAITAFINLVNDAGNLLFYVVKELLENTPSKLISVKPSADENYYCDYTELANAQIHPNIYVMGCFDFCEIVATVPLWVVFKFGYIGYRSNLFI